MTPRIQTKGIHHITAITAQPQQNLNFYEGFLGQKLIKQTVNFDDPSAYHFYYADAVGTPGTVLTFFYWQLPPGQRGVGEGSGVFYAIRPESLSYWKERAAAQGIQCTEGVLPFGETFLDLRDPDGMRVALVATEAASTVVPWREGPVPEAHVLRGFYGVSVAVLERAQIDAVLTLGLGYEEVAEEERVTRYQATAWPGRYLAVQVLEDAPRARQGAGSIHHIAFQASDDGEREGLEWQVNEVGVPSSGFVDRQYFHSCYFMTPAGVLFEIATNDIGFAVDEALEALGETLQIPPHYEADREAIIAALVPITLPRHQV